LESVAKILEIFRIKALKNNYTRFLKPEVEKIEVLDELKNGVVFFVDKNGELLKLRNDFTRSIISYLRKNNLSNAKFWYEGFVYKYSTTNQIIPQFQIGVEKIPFDGLEDSVETLKIIIESYLEAFKTNLLVEIGDSRVIESAISKFPNELRKELLKIIDTKDTTELEIFGKLHNIDVSNLLQIVYNSFRKRSTSDIDSLNIAKGIKNDVVGLIEKLPKYENVEIEIDFSMARTVEEYNGLTFTIYDLTSSSLVAAGGRYRVGNETFGIGGTIFLEEKIWLI